MIGLRRDVRVLRAGGWGFLLTVFRRVAFLGARFVIAVPPDG
jgi:hypothetical protein